MNKFKLLLLSSVVLFTLSACSQMSRFHTDKQYQDSSAQETAKLRLTTNQSEVFIIPNASCIKVSDKILNLRRGQMPEREPRSIFSFSAPPLKEFNQKSLGMVNTPIEIYKDKFGFEFNSSTYASKEFKLTANEPVIIFIKSETNPIADAIELFTKEDGSYATFGATFTPVKNREYQLLLEKDENNSRKLYTAALFDITTGKPENVTLLIKKSSACKL